MNKIINEMFAHMRMQIVSPYLANSRFMFYQVLFLDVSFQQLNLTRGSSYLPPPDWISNKKAVINPQSEGDKECFKWGILATLHNVSVDSHPKRILNLRRFEGSYSWRRLTFPIPLNKISIFEQKNNVSECLGAIDREALHSQKGVVQQAKNGQSAPYRSGREEALCHDQEPKSITCEQQ